MNIDELKETLRMERVLKKYLAKTTGEKCFAILELKNLFSLQSLCLYLGVSRQGFYDWLNSSKPKYKNLDNEVADLINKLYFKFKRKYGYQMLTLFLNKYFGKNLKPWVVYRYMKILKIIAVRIKKCLITTSLDR
ncbi:transposase [Spiroplasma chinense]|nr:transposase [Spiroplasma chinense]